MRQTLQSQSLVRPGSTARAFLWHLPVSVHAQPREQQHHTVSQDEKADEAKQALGKRVRIFRLAHAVTPGSPKIFRNRFSYRSSACVRSNSSSACRSWRNLWLLGDLTIKCARKITL